MIVTFKILTLLSPPPPPAFFIDPLTLKLDYPVCCKKFSFILYFILKHSKMSNRGKNHGDCHKIVCCKCLEKYERELFVFAKM